MAIENSITFGGVNSADFGIYISGEGVFNAPQRDVEMIEIPGRNGEFVLDNGRFNNIEVSYPAFNFEPDDYDSFVQNLSDFRNAICAQRGYQRLTDTFHPDEYRMATYIGGLEIKPIKYNTASEFNIVFNCKPQRWLTSGEQTIQMEKSIANTPDNITVLEVDEMTEIVDVNITFTPQQDLNGQDSPHANSNICPISGANNTNLYVAKDSPSQIERSYSFNFSGYGTVYSGQLNVTTGVLTVDYAACIIDGNNANLMNYVSSSNYVSLLVSDASNTNRIDDKSISNAFPKISVTDTPTEPSFGWGGQPDNKNIRIMDVTGINGVTDFETLKSWLNEHPVTVIYKLENQQTYQLTPTEVEAVIGENYIYSNNGEVCVDARDHKLVNPTLFESSPLLGVSGYGTIGFNDYEIELDNAVMGEVIVAEGTLISGTYTAKSWVTSPLRKDLFNAEDTVTWESSSAIILITGGANVREITSVSVVRGGVLNITSSISRVDSKNYMVGIAVQDYVLSDTYDGAAATPNIIVHFVDANGTSQVESNQFEIHLWLKKTYTNGGTYVFHAVPSSDYFTYLWSGINIGNVVADSTISILGNPTYIDCDIGEAYMVKDGSVISLNQYIDLGSDLPKLASGENEMSYDSTITGLDVTPRWWKV